MCGIKFPRWCPGSVVGMGTGYDQRIQNITSITQLLFRLQFVVSSQSPIQTSDINKGFSSTQLQLVGYFLFLEPYSVNPRGEKEKPPNQSAVCEPPRAAAHSSTTVMLTSFKVTETAFIPILMLSLNLSKLSPPCLHM